MHSKVSSAQIRAARGLLNWTIRDLAAHAGVHRNTITRLEADTVTHGPTIAAIVRALEDGGVEFLDGDQLGVRMAKSKKKR
jgi:transcriptional regulator with XRE-family HTH domain